MLDIIINALGVVGGVSGILVGLHFVAKRTKNPYDDIAVSILEKLSPLIQKEIDRRTKESAQKPKRPVKRDHRP